MIKIVHAADLHLDSAFVGRSEASAAQLRTQLRSVPEKIAAVCKKENCDLLLLSGDLFDGPYTAESVLSLKNALEEIGKPTFIATGNHDFWSSDSPWAREAWPKNVHIFRESVVESVALPELDCRIYGGGFTSMDCPPLLDGFQIQGEEKYHIGVFHGDPTQSRSPYNPISQAQVASSGLDYLALGHIHKYGSFQAGRTLCAWPGCPMGRGYDETEEKGILVVQLEENAQVQFLPLDTTRFYDWNIEVQENVQHAIAEKLPAVGNDDFYRITLTGYCEKPDISELMKEFSDFPNLELRDRTQPPVDIWGSAGTDSLEGVYFRLLRDVFDRSQGQEKATAQLAAELSRKILDGSEVVLP